MSNAAKDKIVSATATITALIALFKVVADSGLLDSLPNIPMKTMGGHTFWNDLANCNGWRLQKNMLTQHCRILDPNDVRRAWGISESTMREELQKLA